MGDFHQTGCIATLHRLSRGCTDRIEDEIRGHAASHPIGLVLPALYSEFERPAMRRIVDELAEVDYLRHIVVAVGRATRSEFEKAKAFFDGFPGPVTFLWIESPGVQDLFATLERHGLSPGPDGKGRTCWLAYGYLLATGECDVIALHDCDIVNYDRGFVARLCYPVVNPGLGFDFVKAFYPRFGERMHGRVTRLFVAPLIRAFESLVPDSGWLRFLGSFRYCLAGEFAMRADLARVNRVPPDWGLEIGVLSEVYRNCAPRRVCQVDLADNYEHKHQALSQHDPSRGLRRMSADIAKALFRSIEAEGAVLTRDGLRALQVRYLRVAEDMLGCYSADARLNGLEYDLAQEELAVSTFARSLEHAVSEYMEAPLDPPAMPNWNRVAAAIPDFYDRLLATVETDAVMACWQAA